MSTCRKPKPRSKPDTDEFGSTNSPPQSLQSTRDDENELAQKGRKPRHDAHVAETPGQNTMSRPSHQSGTKYLKTGPNTRHPTGLAAGATRPKWLRGLEKSFRRSPGGAWPDRNRAWIARERDRNVRRKLAEGRPNGLDTQKKRTRGNPDGHSRGRLRGADTSADRGRIGVGMPCGNRMAPALVAHPAFRGVGRGAGRGRGRAPRQPRRSKAQMRHRIGL